MFKIVIAGLVAAAGLGEFGRDQASFLVSSHEFSYCFDPVEPDSRFSFPSSWFLNPSTLERLIGRPVPITSSDVKRLLLVDGRFANLMLLAPTPRDPLTPSLRA